MGQNLALLVQADIRCALTVLPAGVCYKTVCLWVEEISIPFELTEDYYGNCCVSTEKNFFPTPNYHHHQPCQKQSILLHYLLSNYYSSFQNRNSCWHIPYHFGIKLQYFPLLLESSLKTLHMFYKGLTQSTSYLWP